MLNTKENFSHQFFAPGRINLIGEHIDYSGGHVFPCAITYGTYLWINKRSDRELHLYSENFESLGVIVTHLDNLKNDPKDDWANYPKGVIKIFQDAGHEISCGLDLYYMGNIPNGAGLSSSASIEVVTAWMLNTVFGFGLSMIECAVLSQKAENEFIGVNCGIMDQFACGMGKKDHAILLDTNTLEYDYVPVVLKNHKVVICNTNKRRGLNDSKYNERRSQCEQALAIFKTKMDINAICDLNSAQLETMKHLLDDEVHRRVRHAVSENERTLKAKDVLAKNRLDEFGELMNESHISLRDDYEVTGIELDTIVESAWRQPGVVGARVTGAGFGGCAIAIVETDYVESFIKKVGEEYLAKIGYKADFYVASIGEGAHQII